MATRQFVITGRPTDGGNGLASLGTRAEVLADLSRANTGPEREDGDVLFGPGIRLELPPGQAEVSQMLLTVMEEEIAWLVIERLAQRFGWRILDPTTGRDWSP